KLIEQVWVKDFFLGVIVYGEGLGGESLSAGSALESRNTSEGLCLVVPIVKIPIIIIFRSKVLAFAIWAMGWGHRSHLSICFIVER
ncbi:MAG: hypothetical protein PQJ50_17420, partial [Spirochaetales bacterium]|nr:hypothetical protein [Spirochaetales bacterium]